MDNFVLKKIDFGGRWFKIGGGKKNLRGGQRRKAGAVVWQWVPTSKDRREVAS